jgi:cell division inhibitor SepF
MQGLFGKIKEFWSPEEYDEEYESEVDTDGQENTYRGAKERSHKNRDARNENVINMNKTPGAKVAVFRPGVFDDETCNIADELLKMNTILLNLEGTETDISRRRIIDFMSGVAYASGGKITPVARHTFVITPRNVDITGENLIDGIDTGGMFL